jgi:hypothetical protein
MNILFQIKHPHKRGLQFQLHDLDKPTADFFLKKKSVSITVCNDSCIDGQHADCAIYDATVVGELK